MAGAGHDFAGSPGVSLVTEAERKLVQSLAAIQLAWLLSTCLSIDHTPRPRGMTGRTVCCYPLPGEDPEERLEPVGACHDDSRRRELHALGLATAAGNEPPDKALGCRLAMGRWCRRPCREPMSHMARPGQLSLRRQRVTWS